MHSKEYVDHVAAAIYGAIYKNADGFEGASDNAKDDARLDARTIISARMCGQSKLEAAQRLNTWHWVDRQKTHVPWPEAPEPVKKVMLRKAHAGMDATMTFGGAK